jgi:hypothetical protein
MKTKNYFIAILFILATFGLKAQSFGFGLMATTPQGELKQSGYGTGGGLALEIGTPILPRFSTGIIETRLMGALDLQCLGYSKKIENVEMPTGSNDMGVVQFENTAFGLSIGPRFSFNTGTRLTPYTGVFGSYRLFSSFRHNTLYEDDKALEDEHIYTTGRLQVGVSGGFLFRIGKNTYFDFRMSFIQGGGIQYVNLYDAWKDEDNSIRYRLDKSRTTSLLTTQLGLQFGI